MASSALPCEEMAASRVLVSLSSCSLMPPRRRFRGGGSIVVVLGQTIARLCQFNQKRLLPRLLRSW